eukprot:TRINITY_DN68022_c0_g1_i1.p1 TRINITY_DN68022_c0_g1~~TRINITY_DN68022_c0_g1_i1.p1  ORF type:complete len:294 (-),score=28.53 TRINITY_DN68022_c0_g1_i1:186-1067(-)
MRRRGVAEHPSSGDGAKTAEAKQDGLIYKLAFVRASDSPHFNLICTWAAVLVLVTLVAECTSSTAYGKFGAATAFALPPRVGWWCMEFPVTASFVYFFFWKGGPQSRGLVPRICAAIMCLHYGYRGWIYPYLLRPHPGAQSNFSLLPAVGGWMVTIMHGYLNAKWFADFGKHLKRDWLRDPRFIVGLLMYLSGFASLVYHDYIMRELRSTPGPRYRIPHGGLFEYATQAVYFCELWTWLGFFLMSWGPNGAFIFAVSLANLAPRSVASHEWYLNRFGDEYARLDRKYLIPLVW